MKSKLNFIIKTIPKCLAVGGLVSVSVISSQFLSTVQARDSSTRPLSGTATVLCSVLDDNDNPPEFMQSSFQISLPENLPPGVIHNAQASDSDHGENGTIHYSIVGKDDG